jgi:hypothetical protein
MARSPKTVFESIVARGMATKLVSSSTLGLAFQGVQESIDELKNGSSIPTVDCNTPYSLVVSEVDSNNLTKSKDDGVEATQVLETVSLKDNKGNDLGRVRFESGAGIGVAISNRYEDTIYIHGGQLQTNIEKNAEQISKNVDNCYRNSSATATNAADISKNYSDLLGQIKDLQREVQLLKNILNGSKVKEDEPVAKRKGTN